MSNWVRVDINGSSETNAYINLDGFFYVKALYNNVDGWILQAFRLNGSDSFVLHGLWDTEEEASEALKNLLHGYEVQ